MKTMRSRVASSRASSCVKGVPCAERRMTVSFLESRTGFSATPRDSTAAKIGSGFITMPSPPPNGRSSTVRWRSLVHCLRSWLSTFATPAAKPRPTTPTACTESKKLGKIVIMSKRSIPYRRRSFATNRENTFHGANGGFLDIHLLLTFKEVSDRGPYEVPFSTLFSTGSCDFCRGPRSDLDSCRAFSESFELFGSGGRAFFRFLECLQRHHPASAPDAQCST